MTTTKAPSNAELMQEIIRLRELLEKSAKPAASTRVPGKRNRFTQAQLAKLPPVTDSEGNELSPGQTVKTHDGALATVVRIDRRSRRAVIHRTDIDAAKMTVASRLTVTPQKRARQLAKTG